MSDVTLRPFDPASDFPAITALIGDVNANAARTGSRASTWAFLRKPFEEAPTDA